MAIHALVDSARIALPLAIAYLPVFKKIYAVRQLSENSLLKCIGPPPPIIASAKLERARLNRFVDAAASARAAASKPPCCCCLSEQYQRKDLPENTVLSQTNWMIGVPEGLAPPALLEDHATKAGVASSSIGSRKPTKR